MPFFCSCGGYGLVCHEDRCLAYFKKKLSGLHIRWASCKLWVAFVLKVELQKSGLHSSGMAQQLYIIPLPRTQRFVQSSRFAHLRKSTYWMIGKRYFSSSPIAESHQSLLCNPCLAFQLLFNYFSICSCWPHLISNLALQTWNVRSRLISPSPIPKVPVVMSLSQQLPSCEILFMNFPEIVRRMLTL
jgi:hypothetical protein